MQDPKDKESNAAAKHSSHSGTKVINSVCPVFYTPAGDYLIQMTCRNKPG